MKNHHDISDLIADYPNLTPERWEILKNAVIERARVERADMIRSAIVSAGRLFLATVTKIWSAAMAGRPQLRSLGS